mmetsp:Transcript_11885/g.22774  ORF Transcript_11885/g.22774 Transcript_11885/m.22774 type:complete len:179 (+) Transcript_11885:45-581(+)
MQAGLQLIACFRNRDLRTKAGCNCLNCQSSSSACRCGFFAQLHWPDWTMWSCHAVEHLQTSECIWRRLPLECPPTPVQPSRHRILCPMILVQAALTLLFAKVDASEGPNGNVGYVRVILSYGLSSLVAGACNTTPVSLQTIWLETSNRTLRHGPGFLDVHVRLFHVEFLNGLLQGLWL